MASWLTLTSSRIAALLALAVLFGGIGVRPALAEVSDAEASAFQDFCGSMDGELTWVFSADGSLDRMECETGGETSYDFGGAIVICDPSCTEYPPFTGGGGFPRSGGSAGSKIVLDQTAPYAGTKQASPTPTPQQPTKNPGRR